MTTLILPAPISPQEAIAWAPKHAKHESTPEQLKMVADYLYAKQKRKSASELFGHISSAHAMTEGFPDELVEEARDILTSAAEELHAAYAIAFPYLA